MISEKNDAAAPNLETSMICDLHLLLHGDIPDLGKDALTIIFTSMFGDSATKKDSAQM